MKNRRRKKLQALTMVMLAVHMLGTPVGAYYIFSGMMLQHLVKQHIRPK